MTRFKGKNDIESTSTLAIERSKYNREAFPENQGLGPEQVVDFNFAEKGLYGKVNRQLTPVIAKKEFLVPLQITNDPVGTKLVMNFVVEQFRDFENHFIRACRLGLLPVDDPYLSAIQAIKTYEDPLTNYRSFVAESMSTFNSTYLQQYMGRVFTVEDYIHYLVEYIERLRDTFPLTLSGFQRSYRSSNFSSGLCIDIAGLPIGDDELKDELLLSSPAFDYYLNMAKQYGFSVSKRAPSIIISDLASPVTKNYRSKYNLPTIDSVFTDQYDFAYNNDINLLSNLIITNYNSFVNLNPRKKILQTCSDKTRATFRRRTPINNINNNIIYKLYIDLRNIEERKPFNDSRLNIIKNNAIRILKVDNEKAMRYIDDQFRANYNQKDGSLNSFRKKFEKRLDRR
jgi:hypothetical protein